MYYGRYEQHTKSKAMKYAYKRFQESTDYRLDSVYCNYSKDKEYAFWECCNIMHESKNPSLLRILSHNLMQFSVGFTYDRECLNDETGEVTAKRAFCYITKNYIRWAYIDELV